MPKWYGLQGLIIIIIITMLTGLVSSARLQGAAVLSISCAVGCSRCFQQPDSGACSVGARYKSCRFLLGWWCWWQPQQLPLLWS
jgi:hypothetical protein